MPLLTLSLELLSHICHYYVFSHDAFYGSKTGVDLGVVRHDICLGRYFTWAHVCRTFRHAIRHTIRTHEHGRTVLLNVLSGQLSTAAALLEAFMMDCPTPDLSIRVYAVPRHTGDGRDLCTWHPSVRDRRLRLIFTDYDSTSPPEWQLQWLAVLIRCLHPMLQEVSIPSDFNHFGLPVYVFDDYDFKKLALTAPVVPIVFQNCLLGARPRDHEDSLCPPIVPCLFPYLQELRYPITLQGCWSMRVSLGALDPAYREYVRAGGMLPWSDWQDDEEYSAEYGAHDKIDLCSLIDAAEVDALAGCGVRVLQAA